MKKKIDELYEQYLNEKLDLIFQGEGEEIDNKLFREEIIKSICEKNAYEIKNIFFDSSSIIVLVKKTYYSIWRKGKNYEYGFFTVNEKTVNITEWYDEVEDFYEGYAKVRISREDDKWNFIDTKGNLISKNKWYDGVGYFHRGYGIVYENGKYNFIDTNGKLINKWHIDDYDYVGDFHEGYARVKRENGKWNFIDTKGNLISKKKWYDYVWDFHEGYARVKREDGKWNFVDSQGKIIDENEWYDEVYDFHEGYARVKRNGKWYLIDIQGKRIKETEWYDDVEKFQEGYARVKIDRKWNFVDNQGKIINENEWYDSVEDFHEGYARVKRDGKWNFVDSQGKIINENEWYDEVFDFREGYARVKRENGKWNFIDTKGNLINKKKWYDYVWDFHEGYAIIERNGKYNFIDTKGNLNNICWFEKNPFLSNLSKLGYDVKKRISTYVCKNDINSFNLKYKPYYIFNFNYVLCFNRDKFYLYNKMNNTYEELGNINDIYVCNRFIYDRKNNKVYMISEKQKIDITKYYYDNLIYKNFLNVKSSVERMAAREEFEMYLLMFDEEKYRNILENKKELDRIIQEEIIKKQQLSDVKKAQINAEEESKRRGEIEKNALKSIQQTLSVLQQVSSPSKTVTRRNVDNLFIPVDDHLEINPIFATLLKFIDLSNCNFKNVRINGVDFKGSNINLDPQLVYKKDLSNCNFEGVYIGPFTNFSGVDIRGTRFGPANDKRRIDYFTPSFKYAIYDEHTTYDGRPFTEIFSEETKQTKGGK